MMVYSYFNLTNITHYYGIYGNEVQTDLMFIKYEHDTCTT